MRQVLLICYLCLAFAAACDDRADSDTASVDRSSDPGRDSAVITLERSGCYGRCPTYKLRISANGMVHYVGERFVSTLGVARDSIPHDGVDALIAAAESINYFALADRYVPGEPVCSRAPTDMETTTTSVSLEGRTKRVVHYRGCRGGEVLFAFEQMIDSVVRVERWTKQWLADPATPGSKQSIAGAALAAAASIYASDWHVFVQDSTIVFRGNTTGGEWRPTPDAPDERLVNELERQSAVRISTAQLPLPSRAQLVSLKQIRESFVEEKPGPYAWLLASESRRRSTTIAVSPMVFSQDSSNALVVVRFYCGIRCSRTDLFWLVRDADAYWRVKGELMLSDESGSGA